jgi:glycosyltransferase involved in cell wall biosynthesis
MKHIDKNDVLIAKTDPPLLSIPAQWIARRRGARTIHWLQDIYPEVATALGVPFLKGPIAQALSRLRDRSLRSADAIVVLGDDMQQFLCARGIDRHRIHIIPNWTDDEQISPLSSNSNDLRVKWGLQDKFVVGYSGNLGRAHEFRTLLDAAENLRPHSHIAFLFVGGGHHTEVLMDQVEERGLQKQFRFLPYQPRETLALSLSVPDVHWISLKPELEGLIFPSKFYGIAAAGRPVIAVTAPHGEIARLVLAYDCGVVASPGQSDTLTTQILTLSRDADRCGRFGANARKMLNERFTRHRAFERWRTLLHSLD